MQIIIHTKNMINIIRSEDKTMKAIIMAGGEGSRLRPLTCTRPKPMVKILDKPVMEYIIELLKKHHIYEIGVTMRYLPSEITEYFGDGKDFGVSISYFNEDKPLGTAGSVKNASSFIDSTFMVISGDAFCDIDLNTAIEFHKKNIADATIILKKVDSPLEYGTVVTDSLSRIKRFIEKPDWSQVISNMANTGIYIFEKEILSYIDDDTVCDFSYDVFPKLLHDKKALYGYQSEDYWCDIGDTFAYMSCQYDILKSKAKASLKSAMISEGIYIGTDVTIEPKAQLKAPVYIGNNVKIGEGAYIGEGSVIESDVHIGSYADIKKSIVGTGAHIGSNTSLRACIIGSKAKLKSFSSVYEQSVIGDSCIVGENSIIKPSIKIWPEKVIKPDTTIRTNLVWGNTHKKNLLENPHIRGEIGVDLTPEDAALLGSAFGALLKGGRIGVSSDGGASGQMLAMAVSSGLMSAGCEIYECFSQVCSMTRAALRFYRLDGAVHINSSEEENGHYARFIIMSSDGCDINSKQRRKLQNLLEREDFVRAEGRDIKESVDIENYKEFYIRNILSRLKSKTKDRFLISIKNMTGFNIIRRICSEAGIDAVFEENDTNKILQSNTDAFSSRIVQGGYAFGAIFDNDSQNLILIDNKGAVLDKNAFLLLMCLIVISEKEEGEVFLPVSAPDALAALVKKSGHRLTLTKTSHTEFLQSMSGSDSIQFSLCSDAIFALISIIEYLSQNNTLLSSINDRAKYFMYNNEVECNNESKGKVIKELSKQFDGYRSDFTDGIKIFKENGWVLVIPDAHKPTVNITAEGYTQEFASELASDIIERINKIKNS